MQHLKLGSLEDVPDIKRLLLKFKEASPYHKFPTNETKVEALIYDTLGKPANEAIIILCKHEGKTVGMLVAGASELPFSDAKQASESIWYVEPEFRKSRYGLDLYAAFEYWATGIGAVVVHSAAPKGVPLDRFYKRRGYKLLEHIYIRS
jgi:GNAT superfamily N-acetyltransferase